MANQQATTRPETLVTKGTQPACLVNASVTYCGNNQIYAFGGFDQYTDEVYNHVLKLDLDTGEWSLVDNYGDIPGVRMGHTASLWQGDKLLIYGGENEHRAYLSDVIIFNLKTHTWKTPTVKGHVPKGRARHAATVHNEKLFILGGLTGPDSYCLNDVCYLDLKTWTWSRSWKFVERFDHSISVWGDRLWVFGGLGDNMERTSEIWWLDLKSNPAFKGCSEGTLSIQSTVESQSAASGTAIALDPTSTGYSSYRDGGSTPSHIQAQQRKFLNNNKPLAPGAIGSIRFHSGASVPSFTVGTPFYAYSSGALLDFTTPFGPTRATECSLFAFEFGNLRWQRLANGPELFDDAYRWQYCTLNENGTKAWLIGCTTDIENPDGTEEYLTHVLPIDLTKYGLLGGDPTPKPRFNSKQLPASDSSAISPLSGPAVDLANMFDKPLESGSSSDFQITAERDDSNSAFATAKADMNFMAPDDDQEVQSLPDDSQGSNTPNSNLASSIHPCPPIHVHKLILLARWPHFSRAYAAEMVEFHSKKMHIPEPYSVVRAFLWYLYTDSIDHHPEYCPSLNEVAGMLVLANLYDMPRLKLLCVHRLSREIDVESAAVIWERAGVANDPWLKQRAAQFCLTYWGRVVRTEGFRRLGPQSIVDLCEVVDEEGRVVGGNELEAVGGLGGGRFGVGGTMGRGVGKRRRSEGVSGMSDEIEGEDGEDGEAEGGEAEDMDVN